MSIHTPGHQPTISQTPVSDETSGRRFFLRSAVAMLLASALSKGADAIPGRIPDKPSDLFYPAHKLKPYEMKLRRATDEDDPPPVPPGVQGKSEKK